MYTEKSFIILHKHWNNYTSIIWFKNQFKFKFAPITTGLTVGWMEC